jgi:asparagine synthetase B (glutamine-hydrolysing)
MYLDHGDAMRTLLDAEFACLIVIYDKLDLTYRFSAARDTYGVRPLFVGKDLKTCMFASEIK